MRLVALLFLLLASYDAQAKCAFEIYIAEGTITTNRGIWLEGATVELHWNEMAGGDQSLHAMTDAEGRYFLRFRFYPWNGPAEPPAPYRCDAVLENGTIKVSAEGHKPGEALIKFDGKYGTTNLRLEREGADG